jgi:Trk K+ transport system NAD-binding subunit
MREWLSAASVEQLREALFRNERIVVITLERSDGSSDLVGLMLSEIALPEGTLIAMIRRGDETIIPKGGTVLEAGDRLTALGRPEGITALRERFAPFSADKPTR